MSLEITNNEKDALMRAAYYTLTRNFTKTINRFVVFKDGSNVVEIPHGINQRSKFIEVLIIYFEENEEYEKCDKLLKLKDLVIMSGD